MSEPSEAVDTPGVEVARRIHQEQVQVMPIMGDDEISQTWRVAAAYAKSGIYRDVRQAEQAFAKLMVGRDLGLSPARAMSAVQFVEGNIQIHYRTLLGWVRERGLDYKFPQDDGENPSNERAVIDFYGPKDPRTGEREFLGRSRFSQEDAELAGLRKNRGNAPSNFVKYPRNMLVARATSNGIGWFCPEVLNGVPVYVEGEIPQPEPVTVGQGSGEARNIKLPDAVEHVIKRATELGHSGLSDRATVEMAVADQPEEFVAEWVARAEAEMDGVTDAEVVPDETREQQVERLRSEAADLHEQAHKVTTPEAAEKLEAEALHLLHQADELEEAEA